MSILNVPFDLKDNYLHGKRRINEINQILLINIFTTANGKGQTLTGINGQFFYSQILIDVLLRMKRTNDNENELNILL
jgi:hypothetical protein